MGLIRVLTHKAVQADLWRTSSAIWKMQSRSAATSSGQGDAAPSVGPVRMPVPPLKQTFDKLIKTAKPLLKPEEIKESQNDIDAFLQTEGPKLQSFLEERANTTESWLEDWWLNTAYLEYRDPVVLFSSPGLNWPEVSFKDENERLNYAAHVISGALIFNSMVLRQAIPQEKAGKANLDMAQYYKVYGTTRIPLAARDLLRYADPKDTPDTVVVMYKNHAYSIRVFDKEKLLPVPTAQILGMLKSIVSQSQTCSGSPVGLLTSEHRDRWARSYTLLCRNAKNLGSLEAIERALFVVCLDQPLPMTHPRGPACQNSVVTLHGGGHSCGNAANRWFDKTVQFVIGANSDGVGITYEHSPAEGGPIGVVADLVIDHLKKAEPVTPAEKFEPPRKLEFEVSPEVSDAIREAGKNIDRLAADLDLFGYKFRTFGKKTLKELKTSPDSFIQIAIQYAFYKSHKKPAAQYESGTLRRFKGGRTEVVRTCSEESYAFCKSEGNPDADRFPILMAALTAHKNYCNEAMAAAGVDRHILGLKLIAKERGLPLHKVFSSPAVLKTAYYQLSTSNVPTKADGFMIYAPLVDDGYACCYNPREDGINFGITAWKHNSFTNVDTFQRNLEIALNNMRDILATAQKAKSKL